MQEYDIKIIIIGINKVIHVYNNYIIIYLSFAHSIESKNNYNLLT